MESTTVSRMKRPRLIVLALCLAALAGACGDSPSNPAGKSESPPGRDGSASGEAGELYEASGLVLDDADGGPEFCLGFVNESLPPQCEGIPLSGWSWAEVEAEESAASTTWGDYHLVGSYDGETFAVQEAGPPKDDESTGADPIGTPCEEPPGGWTVSGPGRASDQDIVAAQQAVSPDPEFAGLWVDYYDEPAGGPTEEDPGKIILNVAFTDNVEQHERELREEWGGPLCVTRQRYSVRELQKIQRTFPADEFDLDTLWSDIDVVRGFVEIGVVSIDDETLQRIEDRYGEGVVRVDAGLEPVD